MNTFIPLDAATVPCRANPDGWFPDSGDNQTAMLAKHICKTRCRLLDKCKEHGVRFESGAGIFGGLTPDERRRERAERGIVAVTPQVTVERQYAARARKDRIRRKETA